jgi:hypothetical protein
MNFATVMLLAWIPITAVIFRRFSPSKAVIVTLLYGYLFLPQQTGLDLPVLPTLDKALVPSLCAFFFYALAQKKEAQAARAAQRRSGEARSPARSRDTAKPSPQILPVLLVCLSLAACVVTFLTNRHAEVFGPLVLRGMTPYDMLAMLQGTLFALFPLWLIRKTITTRDTMVFALKALVIAALIYSILILFESRFSPQLHRWIYGFHAHSFAQHIRGGSFRAMVFVGHGLRVGIFIVIAMLAAATLFRITSDKKQKSRWLLALLWLFPVLYLSRNSGAFFLSLLFVPTVLFTPPRLQLLIAAAFSLIVLLYPMARGAGLIPIDAIIAQAESVDPARAQSLAFRITNEDQLLDRANLKPLGGWGTWNRNRVYDQQTGRDLSVTDGTWIIKIGVTGWLGYIGLFALLCLPPILLAVRRKDPNLGMLEAGLCIMLAVNLIDMIPNSSLVVHAWMLSGILWARLAWPAQTNAASDTIAAPASQRRASATSPRRKEQRL